MAITRFLILFFISSLFSARSQCEKTIEEIALYHLDRLTKDKKINFDYFTNGYIEKDSTYLGDVLQFRKSKYERDTILLNNPFNSCTIFENKNPAKISIPNKMRREKQNSVLNIYRFVKYKDKYYVGFSLETNIDVGGKTVLLIMNLKGDLININYSTYIQ